MSGRLAHIAGQERMGSLHLTRVHCPKFAPQLRPGYFVLLRLSSVWDPYLRLPLFPVVIDSMTWLVYHHAVDLPGLPLLHQAPPGTQVQVWGPFGTSFPRVEPNARVLVVAQEIYVPYVLGLARDVAVDHDVVLVVERNVKVLPDDLYWLPPAVEFQPVVPSGGRLEEVLSSLVSWADRVFVAGPSHWPHYIAYQLERLWPSFPPGRAFALVPDGIMCGLGVCHRCAISTPRGPVRVCRKGPVLDLAEWFGPRRSR